MKKRYYRTLDYIRIMSCIAVLAYHLGIIRGGYLAVSVFFILSGYLSAVSFQQQKHFSFKQYYLKKFMKIYLPLLACVFMSIAIIRLIPAISWINLKPETTSVIFAYNNFWQIGAELDYFTKHNSSPFMHMWYIAILLQFDLIFPLLALLLKKAGRKISKAVPPLVMLVMALSSFLLFMIRISSNQMIAAYYGTFSRLFSLCFGVLLAYIHIYFRPLVSGNKQISVILFYVYLLIHVVIFIFAGNDPKYMGLFMLGTNILCMRMIDHAIASGAGKQKSDRLIIYLAGLTYEIYLVQYPLIFMFEKSAVPVWLKVPILLILIMICAYVLNYVFNIRKRSGSITVKVALSAIVLLLSIFGLYTYVTAKDNSAEMADLQNRLDENQKLIEEKNREYLETLEQQQAEWEAIKGNLDNEEEIVREMLKRKPVTGVGDSILLDCVEQLYEYFPLGYFDGKISRSLYAGEEILRELKAEGKLGDIVILFLANNGDYYESVNEELMNIVEGREVFWMNAVGADDPQFNDKFAQFAQSYPNLHIVDWVSRSEGHPEYFYYDGIHVVGDGSQAMADLIYESVYDVYLDKYRKEGNEQLDEAEKKLRNMVYFYGDEALISSYSYLDPLFEEAVFNARADYMPDELINEFTGSLPKGKIVLVFDKNSGFGKKQYEELVDLCKDRKLYICVFSANEKIPTADNVTIIDFYQDINDHSEYLLTDGIHLTPAGNEALASRIAGIIG